MIDAEALQADRLDAPDDVLPPERPADVPPDDADAIVAQVLAAIDRQPQLHPPAWPAEP